MNGTPRFRYWVPIVRLNPKKTFFPRIFIKIKTILILAINRILCSLKIRGGKVVGFSKEGNVYLKFSVDTPIGMKNEKILLPRDYVIFQSIRTRGSWEKELCSFLAQIFNTRLATNQTATHLLDIGAHSGMIAIQTSRLSKNPFIAFCVEPLPINLEALHENMARQSILTEYKIFPYALGNRNQKVPIYTEKSNYGNTSLYELIGKNTFTTQIDLRSTAEFVENEIPRSASLVLKLDTQGSEIEILSNFPDSLWSQIMGGVIEVRGSSNLNHDKILLLLQKFCVFDKLFFEGNEKKIELSELERFWLNNSGEERNLYFSR